MLEPMFGIISDVITNVKKRICVYLGIKSPVVERYLNDSNMCNVILINGFTSLTSERLMMFNDWSFWIDKLALFGFNIYIPIFNDFENMSLQDHVKCVDNMIDQIHKDSDKDIHIIAFSYGTLVANEIIKKHIIKTAVFIASPIVGVNKFIYENSQELIKSNKTAWTIANYRSQIDPRVLLIYAKNDCLVKSSKDILPNLTLEIEHGGHYLLLKNTRVIFFCILNILNNKLEYCTTS